MLDDFVKRMVVKLQLYHLIDDETAEYEYVLIGQKESSITYCWKVCCFTSSKGVRGGCCYGICG